MRRKMLALLGALLMLSVPTLAEVLEGTTVPLRSESVFADADGVLDSIAVCAGETVQAGDVLGEWRTEKVFAGADGTVAAIHAHEGEICAGSVLEIMPVEKYAIYCTVSEAYSSASAKLVHSGETLYMKCTNNGTHRGVGVVTQIDGSEYRVLATGGEFHVGETVYLYRDTDFTKKQRVGIGTVVENDTVSYEGSGTVVKMHVAEGEYVERGELLYELIAGREAVCRAHTSGIVSEVGVSQGDTVQKEQELFRIVPEEAVCLEAFADETEAVKLQEGTRVQIVYTADPKETPYTGTVIGRFDAADEGRFRVLIGPDDPQGLKLGMTAQIRAVK